MESYNCIVRLDGEMGQEVPKSNICAAHVIMLQNEHGGDAVHSISLHSKQMRVDDHTEKMVNGKKVQLPQKVVNQVMARNFLMKEFGPKKVGIAFGTTYGAMLPETLPGFDNKVSMKKKVTPSKKAATVAEDELDDELEADIETGPEDDESPFEDDEAEEETQEENL